MDIKEIYRYTWSLAKNRENRDIEDIVQDAVLYTWETIQRRENLTRSFLKRRIYYCILNAVKKYDKQQRHNPTDPEDIIITFEDSTIELPMRRVDEDGNEIRPGLTPRQREVVEAIIRNRFEYVSAAEELGISRSTLSIHWSWAKSGLRRAFQDAVYVR